MWNFFSNDHTAAIETSFGEQYINQSYYFIDDVSVEKYPNDEFTFTGNTILCERDTFKITASAGVDEVIWTTLTDTINAVHIGETFSFVPMSNAAYRVKAKGCGKTIIDTVLVEVRPRP